MRLGEAAASPFSILSAYQKQSCFINEKRNVWRKGDIPWASVIYCWKAGRSGPYPGKKGRGWQDPRLVLQVERSRIGLTLAIRN